MAARRTKIVYCSWSKFKIEEWATASGAIELSAKPGSKMGDLYDLEFRQVLTSEPLLCNLEDMVNAKIKSAYQQVKVPCIVEHAGLILKGYESASFPGGLTQPMWDSLGPEKFVECVSVLSNRAIARAIIGYCDGMNIRTFVGETHGKLIPAPKGSREFYWDTVFCPDEGDGRTYAQIAQDDLIQKLRISQSMRALDAFMTYRITNESELFPSY